MMRLAWLAFAVACSGNDVTPTDTDTETPGPDPVDTSTPTDITDTKVIDTGNPAAPANRVRFTVTGEWAGLGVSFSQLNNPLTQGTYLDFGGFLQSEAVPSAEFSVDLDTPSSLDLRDFPDYPGIQWAVYVAGLFEDDGDGRPEEGEAYAAASQTYLVYLSAPSGLPEELQWFGLRAGWNALNLYGTLWPHAVPMDSLTLTVRELQNSIVLSGTYDSTFAAGTATTTTGTSTGTVTIPGGTGDTGRWDTGRYYYEPMGPIRLAVVPSVGLYGFEPPEMLLYDEAIAASWTISIVGAPPEDHGLPSYYYDYDYAPYGRSSMITEIPLAYSDQDESGSYTRGDWYLYSVCDTATFERITLLWAERSDDLATTFLLDGHHGWMSLSQTYDYYYGGSEISIQTGVLTGLAIGSGCYDYDRDPF